MYRKEYDKWVESPCLSAEDKAELRSLAGNEAEIEARFYAPLEFGTAGLRGIMGPGLHLMNVYNVRHATQGFAELIKNEGEKAMAAGVAVCYDCRENSELFAREAACVLAGNGIFVRLFDSLRPTPELSFAIRHYKMTAGINITASHNPKQYNGYKVYWSDGAQLPPEHAAMVSKAMADSDIFDDIITMDYAKARDVGLICIIGEETDELFLNNVLSQSVRPEAAKAAADNFKVVFTPFHGTGYRLVPEALKRLGLKNILTVAEQMEPDGTFPTVKSPNPEDKAGFELAISLAQKEGVDLIIGTDPDADRVGIVVRDSEGVYRTISGNQAGVLLIDYIISARRENNTLPDNAAVIKTIVTTEMARKVCIENDVEIFDTFTGFKFMAELIGKFERENSHKYIFAYEESYGYLAGDHARDKDAVTAAMLIAEMAAWYFTKGKTLYEAMQELYNKYGYFGERTINLVMPGLDGLKKMASLMEGLRNEPPKNIADCEVITVRDYLSGKIKNLKTGETKDMELRDSNVLYFDLSDGSSFIVRPSGTEPKVKVYILTRGKDSAGCNETIEKYASFAQSLVL